MENDKAFWELFRDGQTCEVLTEENELIFLGKLYRTRERSVVELRESSGGTVPPVLYNTPVKLRLYFPDVGRRLLAGSVCGSSLHFWRADHLRPLHGEEKRQVFRQKVSVPCKVLCVNEIYASRTFRVGETARTVEGRLEDLSLGGALIRCREDYESGDWLLLMGVALGSLPPFTFTGRVRWAEQLGPGERRYGCQFQDMEAKEEDRLFRAIFELQRRDVQERRRDR